MAEKKAPRTEKTKAATGKKAAGRKAEPAEAVVKPRRVRKAPVQEPTPEERWRMVAEAAYYIAEKRGFVGGDPAHDWYEAEEQVALFLQQARKPTRKRAGA